MFSVFVLIFECHLLHVNTTNFFLGPIQLNLIEFNNKIKKFGCQVKTKRFYIKGGGTGGAGGARAPPKISNTQKVPFFLSEKCPFF